MLQAMQQAPVGDDVYGDDPTVNLLEQEVASLTGKASALFVPSGTMANQLAIAVHTHHGDSILAEEDTHCFLYEAGAASALSGVQFDLIPYSEKFSDEAMAARFRAPGLHSAETKLVIVENTHNRQLGRAMPLIELQRIQSFCKTHSLAYHCDGARIWNAAVALETTVASLASPFTTIAVCFSKGLGAPVGSALCGPAPLIAKARKLRKRWGGAMRQSGYLAAAALFGIMENRERIASDHANAIYLANELKELEGRGASVKVANPCTNMVYLHFNRPCASQFVQALKSKGVLINPISDRAVRFVTHLDVDQTAISAKMQDIKQAFLSIP
jgi:threonine aldolase